jgi:hypothetical protein
MSDNPYFPPNKEGTKLQAAQYWLERAVAFEDSRDASGNPDKQKMADMAFNMALKCEREHHGQA